MRSSIEILESTITEYGIFLSEHDFNAISFAMETYADQFRKTIYGDTIETKAIVKSIIDNVLEYYQIDNIEVLKKKNKRPVFVEPRFIIMYLVHNYANLSLAKIGNLLNRDHSTVLYANKELPKWFVTDKQFRSRFTIVCHKIFDWGKAVDVIKSVS